MSKLEKLGLPLVGCAMLVFGGLWIAEQRANVKLNRELGLTRDQLFDAEANLDGLKEANRRLQLRLQEIPVLALTGEWGGEGRTGEVTLSSAVWDEFEEEEEPEVVESESSRGRSGRGNTETEEQERTPEEEAEREARRAEREKQRLEYRQRMTDDLQARREFFSLINTEGLSPEYAEANTRLIESMGEMQILLAQMSVEGLSRDERREVRNQLRENSREVRQLMETQKDVLLFDYADLELGLDEQKQQEFIEYMKTIDAYTSSPWRSGGGRSRR